MTENNNKIEKETTIQSFDDIVFEKRNKAYGAYYLRKKYRGIVFFAFFASFIILGTAVAVPLIDAYNNKETHKKKKEKIVSAKLDRIKTDEAAPPPPPPPPPPPAQLETVARVAPPKVVDSVTVEIDMATADENKNVVNDAPVTDVITAEEVKEDVVQVVERVFIKVEQSATFQGGNLNDFRSWVSTSLVYPPEALELGSQGLVVLQFCVNSAGTVCDVTFLKSSGFPYLDNEARRVVLTSPKWSPGRQGGSPVKQQFTLPINFQLGQQ